VRFPTPRARWDTAPAAACPVDPSREYVEHTIPQLRQTADFSLELLASAEANILTMLLTRETGEPTTHAPPEAIAYAVQARLPSAD
jgi:hypothetical protein